VLTGPVGAIAATGLAALLITACTSSSATHTSAGGHAKKLAVHAAPPRVVSVTPAPGSASVNGTSPITVTYTAPLPADDPLPQLSPAIAGSWQRRGDTAVFTPDTGFAATTRVTVTVPSGTSPAAATATFTTGRYSTLRLQELLAQLGYLPMTWTANIGGTVTPSSAAQQLSAAYDPPSGSFTWATGYPGQLHSFWKEGSPNMLTRGAVIGFQASHGLPIDGNAGPALWAAVLKAAVAGQGNTQGYSYAIADENIPETLTIWHDGRVVLRSPANTGIGVAPTPVGTFPVYEKLPFQVMQGTNPDGSHYADPVSWVSYFAGGAAVHYISRGSYGSPQSLGCVELPYYEAKRSYPYLPYGTLVTVMP